MAADRDGADARRLIAGALARWEGEGGALKPDKPAGGLDELDVRILTRLGAALLAEWNSLPTEVQRAVFHRASTPDALGDSASLKSEIANFLHTHKDR